MNFISLELPDAENYTLHNRVFVRLYTIPECDGITDRRTEMV